MAEEIILQTKEVEYVFVPVSTCGVVSGLSQYLKQFRSTIKIIAVDLESSSIFQKATVSQHLPAMGFHEKPGNLSSAKIDDIVIVNEPECIRECYQMRSCSMLIGASSGASIAGIKKYFKNRIPNEIIVAIFPDRGERYLSTVYNADWCAKNYPNLSLRGG